MRPASSPLRFACLFALIYGALIVPWPGWNMLYGRYFRFLNGLVLSSEGPGRVVRFNENGAGGPLDTAILVVAANQLPTEGKVEAVRLSLDSRGVGWIPTALLFSLILSTPVSWARRGWAFLLGAISVHLFIVLTCAVNIWDATLAPLGLGAAGPAKFERWVAAGLNETLVVQLGASFVVPAIIWILITFKREDLEPARASATVRRSANLKPLMNNDVMDVM